jgi:hypothetical protein
LILHTKFGLTLERTAEVIGGIDHATVLHGIRKVRTLLSVNDFVTVDSMNNWIDIIDELDVERHEKVSTTKHLEEKLSYIIEEGMMLNVFSEGDVSRVLDNLKKKYK